MKINLDFQFKTLSGIELNKINENGELIELHNCAKALATCLWLSIDKNMKFKIWAEDLYKTGELDIDKIDLETLIAWIELYGTDPNKNYQPWFAQVGIKGQVIDELKKQKLN